MRRHPRTSLATVYLMLLVFIAGATGRIEYLSYLRNGSQKRVLEEVALGQKRKESNKSFPRTSGIHGQLQKRCETMFAHMKSRGINTSVHGAVACAIVSSGNPVELIIANESAAGQAAIGYCMYFKNFLQKVTENLQPQSFGAVTLHCSDLASFTTETETFLTLNGVPLASHAHIKGDDGTCPENVVIIPDPHYISTGGFQDLIAEIRDYAQNKTKIKKVYWRGASTGIGHSCDALIRTKFAKAAKHTDLFDIKFSLPVQRCGDNVSQKMLSDEGLISPRVSESVWVDNHGIVDISGNVHAWGLFWRLASGSIVFQVHDTNSSYCHMLEADLKPWVHYIPVTIADFSKLDSLGGRVLEDEKLMSSIKKASFQITQKHTYEFEAERVATDLQKMWSKAKMN